MESRSISGVDPRIHIISSMTDRCRACVAAHGDHMEVTPNIVLDSIKCKGSLIFGSAFFVKENLSQSICSMVSIRLF